jgi:hypothetical protein
MISRELGKQQLKQLKQQLKQQVQEEQIAIFKIRVALNLRGSAGGRTLIIFLAKADHGFL